MDINVFRGLLTLLVFLLFLAIVFWAYGRGRKADFDAAAQLPLDDADPPRRENGNAGSA